MKAFVLTTPASRASELQSGCETFKSCEQIVGFNRSILIPLLLTVVPVLDRYKARYYVNKGMATFNDSLRIAGHTGLICKDPSGEVRKVYPLPFIFTMDLGEQYVVAGVMAKHCAAWEVPKEKYADLRAARRPGYPVRTVEAMQKKRREMRLMSAGDARKEATKTGVYPRLKVRAELLQGLLDAYSLSRDSILTMCFPFRA